MIKNKFSVIMNKKTEITKKSRLKPTSFLGQTFISQSRKALIRNKPKTTKKQICDISIV